MRWFTVMMMCVLSGQAATAAEPASVADVVLVIHGGLGLPRKEVDAELEKQLRQGLEDALRAGYAALQEPDKTGLDAVEVAIRLMEDSPLFNAGKGAVFTHEGRNELDASIMEGKDKRAGAVAGVTVIKNPITAARAVMEKSKHVMLVGRGAEVFATQQGLEIVDPAYFWTLPRWKQIQESWKKATKRQASAAEPPPHAWGTVGAVALDRQGNLAAGTSTGGMNDKRFGRIGDSPVIGAGTYADNRSCGVSCTGHGEYFIRFSVARTIAALVEYKDMPASEAADEVVNRTLKEAGGEGGVIVLDPKGNCSWAYNSEGLFRGYITSKGKTRVMLYAE